MAVMLGLTAAVAYGIGDFVAGLLSRRISFMLVAVIATVAATVLTGFALAATTRVAPTVDALAWGAISGVGSALGTLALYRGLGRGHMSVVAPLSAVCTALIPVLVGVLIGDRPSPLAWLGMGLALPAVWLVSALDPSDTAEPEPRKAAPPASRVATGVPDGLLAGVAFAVLLIGLARAGDGSGLWPVVANQLTSLVVLVVFAGKRLRRSARGHLPFRHVAGAATVGVAGAVATVMYFLSTQAGLLAIVAVVTSLYPAFTVALAAVVLRERVGMRQGVGLALSALTVILIVGG
jgi:drug/metabolite transporter (DMT)-like permease